MNEPQSMVAEPEVEVFEDWDGFVFDPDYFHQPDGLPDSWDETGIAIFKMVRGLEVQYLHLFNIHNGYYAHGFSFQKGDTVIEGGSL